MRTGLCFGLLLLLAACDVNAIFEEQAGENDWHAEFIGQVTATHVLGRDKIAVATASNVIAVLSSTTGDIVWRQVLHSSDQLQHIAVLSKPAAVLSLSSSGTVLRAWQQIDGSLLWEQYLPAQAPSAKLSVLSVIPEATVGSGQKVIVTTAIGSKVCHYLAVSSSTLPADCTCHLSANMTAWLAVKQQVSHYSSALFVLTALPVHCRCFQA